ncbi:transcriptional regulator [Photobacterium proteolyticum]|uniref:Transcriptional regulator n=1 Tax=Photobacterium proteolyticum TaxID=1903952 RepID=A0A1Q9H7M1_9GAMM|nr:helix-turn-helix domain-containing protein [Photobacterium proteolyticum]OLQ83952.1 transcriptional regulator [Photobacterium proteolyticum]
MSDILKAVHETVSELHEHDAIDKTTLRQFDALCLTPMHEYNGEEVRTLRESFNLSQSVFAQYLNVSTKLVQKWEQNASHPKGAALKLLALAQKNGIDAIA